MPTFQNEKEGSVGGDVFEAPKATRGRGMGRGFPLSSRLGDLGERRKLPQQGPGQRPGRPRFGAFWA